MNQSQIKTTTLVAMCLALFMANLNGTVVNLSLPKIQLSLVSEVSGLQWILNAYTLPAASLVLPGGILGDIYGRKRVFLIGLVMFTIASGICGLAPSLGVLIVGRSLQGIGAAALVPGSLSILTDVFPEPKEKAKAISIWTAVSGLALIAGPILGGLFVDNLGWQSVFFLNLPLGVIAFWVIWRVVRESKNPNKQSLDSLGAILSVVSLASLTYILTQGHAEVWRSQLTIYLLAIAGLSLVAFLVVEFRSHQPMLPLNLFQNPTFAVVNITSVLVVFTIASLLFIFSLFLQQVLGYSAATAGLCFVPMNVAFVLASFVSGWVATRVGCRFAITVGLLLESVATFSFAGVSTQTRFADIIWNLILSGIGSGLALSPLTAAAMSSAPPTQAGIASAILNTSRQLGSVFGVAILGTIFTQQIASNLARSLIDRGIPSNLQGQIITNVLRGGVNNVSQNLPTNISSSTLHQAIHHAFVAGLHTSVLVAGFALLVGALLILVFMPSTIIPVAKVIPLSAAKRKKGR